ncbi:ATP-binding cassette domain-containing protein [Breoghania sp.]|uniref:ATP-binding cassette domain-containing protein n=1 Tax=Breoghania sp. TaxID=2065378 RepID=UPI00263A0495|nr:ATP-binding cassette domain-containing protein [Breoghania sp.]MDJ0930667.1 ATP-binding cassette domain-containing protein [Breoghania sp.]
MSFLDIHDLGACYSSLRVLDGIDLSVEKGEVVSLIGPFGSGKNTLLKVIAGLMKPDRGHVTLLRGRRSITAIGSR